MLIVKPIAPPKAAVRRVISLPRCSKEDCATCTCISGLREHETVACCLNSRPYKEQTEIRSRNCQFHMRWATTHSPFRICYKVYGVAGQQWRTWLGLRRRWGAGGGRGGLGGAGAGGWAGRGRGAVVEEKRSSSKEAVQAAACERASGRGVPGPGPSSPRKGRFPRPSGPGPQPRTQRASAATATAEAK